MYLAFGIFFLIVSFSLLNICPHLNRITYSVLSGLAGASSCIVALCLISIEFVGRLAG